MIAQETPASVPATPLSEPESEQTTPEPEDGKIHLQSVQRITNLPVISSGINLTTDIYSKVKESNAICRFLFSSAESTVNKATKLAEPVTNVFEKPIKFADSTFCTTMDVVGNTIPKVIETPQKICSKAINVVGLPVQPAVDCVKKVGDYGKQTVNHIYSKVQGKNPATTSEDTNTDEYENENETEQENHDQSDEPVIANGH